jgi:hypothetical protein
LSVDSEAVERDETFLPTTPARRDEDADNRQLTTDNFPPHIDASLVDQ